MQSEYPRPWTTLWVVLFGLFMILLDSTIVSVANPAIKTAFGADYSATVWVTSAYLLGYAVPLLISGRLGDQFGPRFMYLAGLAVFTAASLWCGLAGSIGWLITARVVQGIGAAMLTPQTLTVVQRVFPPQRRGTAMGVWGAVAGIATLVGPVAGGVLVDGWGWQWIFYVNVPVGVLGMILGAIYIPRMPTHPHRLDLLGMALSASGMFAFVFALQEGESFHWAPGVWGTMAAGLAALGVFVWWQSANRGEPLIPLRLFADRNFSLAGVSIASMGFCVISTGLPMMFYAQLALGFSPTKAALTQAPTAIVSGVLAPVSGWLVDRVRPSVLIGGGVALMIASTLWWTAMMRPETQMWQLMLPAAGIGAAMACIWGPLATTATRNLPSAVAGAGSGVYNTLRQVGGVVGSSAMGALMTARLASNMPAMPSSSVDSASGGVLPPGLRAPFSTAMSQSMLLGVAALVIGLVATLFMRPAGSQVGAVPLDHSVPVED
ncbi:DHA2 family efflux MFS transporter permease subunit [Mycobacteroides salmoniphilum]|uniref:DHA2 family efflux MFS transporter permease subunit n=1 Tax=Mycobacteroides salmoniphilum TaxID=404941 RepID=UPI000D6A3131|nr:DHA2 family efflux MFS transporter permease subunit [Mycobacteroides salmoniphilum]QCH23011.1 Multidrug resistance protein stp [Mycobacteroides salmoniphilum]